ncbi:unnamed protein product [Discosporangium mesarthrocarpum]
MREVKRKHRPRLRDWTRDGFGVDGSRAAAAFEALVSSSDHVEQFSERRIAREKREELTPHDFWEKYERKGKPVVISGIPWHEGWAAEERWSWEQLRQRYGNCKMKCGEDDDGYAVKVRMKYFLRYMESQQDDSPLYVFDSHFDDHRVAKELLEDFKVPDYFPDDLFQLVGERRRPPYRWFLLGPRRSGTSVHVDPLGTSAWNTVIVGRKRWVLFPPGTDRNVAKARHFIRGGEDDEPVDYFVDHLPRLRRAHSTHDRLGMIEFVQHPGETVFVPGGWWHAVINMDNTIAVTQNFCSRNNFRKVWRKTRTGRKKMSVKWLRALGEAYPALHREAICLNHEDSFEMYNPGDRGRGRHDADKDKQRGKKKRSKSHKRLGKRRGSGGDSSREGGGGIRASRGSSLHKRGRQGREADRDADRDESCSHEGRQSSTDSMSPG